MFEAGSDQFNDFATERHTDTKSDSSSRETYAVFLLMPTQAFPFPVADYPLPATRS
jgi:hypothetical protein